MGRRAWEEGRGGGRKKQSVGEGGIRRREEDLKAVQLLRGGEILRQASKELESNYSFISRSRLM